MRTLRSWVLRVASLFGAGRRNSEIAEELEAHRDFLVAEHVRSGMTPEAARRRAAADLGSLAAAADRYRDRRGLPWLQRAATDLAYACRGVWRRPALVVGVVLTVSLGVFGTTALARAVLETAFRTPPGARVDGLYAITTLDRRTQSPTSQIAVSQITGCRRQRPGAVDAVAMDAACGRRRSRTLVVKDGSRSAWSTGSTPRRWSETSAGRWIEPDDDHWPRGSS
jgi:hypothetical protein